MPVRRSTRSVERLNSKSRINRYKKEASGAFTLMARKDREIAKIDEKIEQINGTTHQFKNDQKKFLEYQKNSAVKQTKILRSKLERAKAKVIELEDYNVELNDSRDSG